MAKQAMIVLAHGSRNNRANAAFLDLVERVRKETGIDNIAGAFFSLADPDLSQVVDRLVDEQIQEIAVFPYFLFDGSHVNKDIPELIQRLKARHPGTSFTLLKSLEHEPLMLRIIADKTKQIL